mgnify:CR=1 FL=1
MLVWLFDQCGLPDRAEQSFEHTDLLHDLVSRFDCFGHHCSVPYLDWAQGELPEAAADFGRERNGCHGPTDCAGLCDSTDGF